MTEPMPGPVLVMGAGSVGCFIGGRLQAAGAQVRFVGRPRVLDGLRAQGLALTDLAGGRIELPAAALQLLQAPAPPAALVLLCVKSGATAAAARELAAALPAGTPVLSLQNGVDNAATAAAAAPALRCLPGMVPFNIAELGPGRFHRGTGGRLAAQDDPLLRPWLPLFEAAGLPLVLHADLRPVLWGKLVINLNNPVNALSGLPLREQLLDRDCRLVWAALQREALAALDAAGIVPAQVLTVPPRRMPALLKLPNWAFRRVAARMLRIDPKARSSMADDLALGRPTEIDALSGAVVRLARSHGRSAPLNERLVALLSVARPAPIGGRALRHALGL
ncbi:MAG: 2-dehydropantoate 2-reductase [Burkholderiales bacterium]|nr:2-dehydropantoate 2-reductase [Burkholderiales bacterium]